MSQKSRTDYSILNIATGLGGYFINTILGFVCRMIFVRCLADDYLGINGLLTNILSMLSLAELGVGSAIIYALYKPLAENDEEKIASLMKFFATAYKLIGCVVAVIGISLMPFLHILIKDAPDIKESMYLIYSVYLFNTSSTYFFSYRSSLLAAAQKNYIVTGLSYIISIIQNIIQMILLICTHDYLVYLLVQTIATLLFNVIISSIAKKQYPYIVNKKINRLSKSERKSLVSNVKALTIWKLSGLLVNSTDNIIITYFKGLKTVGYSTNYTLLSTTLNALINQIFTSITASVGNLNAKESDEKKIKFFNFLNLSNFWIFGWTSILIFIVSSDLVRLFYGDRFVLADSIPFVIALNYYMVGMQNAVWTYKNTMGLFRQGRYLLLITAVINLVCSIALGNIWGLFGILLATAIARLFTNTWYDAYAVFKYGFKKNVKQYYLRYLVFGLIEIICGYICYNVCALINNSLVVDIFLKSIICSVMCNIIFFAIFRRTEEYNYAKQISLNVIKKFRKSK